MKLRRTKKIRKLIDIIKIIYSVKREILYLKPQFEAIFECNFNATIANLNEILENMKVITGDLLMRNIYQSLEK